MALDPFGLAAAIGGKTKQTPIYANLDAQKALNESAARQGIFGSTTRPAAIADYTALLKAATPANEAVSKERTDWFHNVLSKADSYDPFLTSIKPSADYLFQKAADIAPASLSLTRLGDNQNRINLGLSPGGQSSAADRARMSAVGGILTNTFGQVLPTVTNWAQLDANERNNQFLRSIGALEGLTLEPDRLAGRALLPAQAEAAGYTQDVGNLGQLIGASTGNIQGYQAEPNIWARLGTAAEEEQTNMQTMLGTAASMYGSMYGGGGRGGMYSQPNTGGTARPTGPSLQHYMGPTAWNPGYQTNPNLPYGGNFDIA